MSISPTFATRFFQLITERKFAEAERMLERLREKVEKTEWNEGYLQALNGMLLAKKTNNDRSVFLSNANFENKKELQKYREEFLEHAKNRLHADYDRGFFSAWAEYTRLLSKMKPKEQLKLTDIKQT